MFVDDLLPQTMFDAFHCGLMVLGAVVVVCIGSPSITLILIPIVPIFLYLRMYFVKSSRELKRLDALHRSPLFSHIAESLDGLTTLRAYGTVKVFQEQHKRLLDQHTRADFAFMSSSRWLGVRLDLIVCLLLAAATFGATYVSSLGVWSSPEALVAGVMYVLQLAGNFQWAIRQSAEVENMMVSVERIIQYSHLDSEPPLVQAAAKGIDLENWPPRGEIVAKQVRLTVCCDIPLAMDSE
jgi:ATP-binding cassette subfamily C (CFTR/MRP) protein 4